MKKIKADLRRIPVINRVLLDAKRRMQRLTFTSSKYWESRYLDGGTSGAGSYGRQAQFKADILNKFVTEKQISEVIEFGFGDGNQLTFANYPRYIGYDVSVTAVENCRAKFSGNTRWSFYHVSEFHNESADLTLSLDVIYHLIEDAVYDDYMRKLFRASTKFVVIYSSDTDDNSDNSAIHVRHRKFTRWVDRNEPSWSLLDRISNPYPIEKYGHSGSFADFYIFEKGQ